VESFRFAEKDPTMARKRVYPPEFRAKILELVRSGRSANSIAREYEIARLTITNWLKQDDLDAGRRADGLTTAESVEVAKLRKKVRELEIERDILKKAAENSTDQRNTSFSLLAGVPYCKVLRGRWFSLRAMRLRSA
jgi:transposase